MVRMALPRPRRVVFRATPGCEKIQPVWLIIARIFQLSNSRREDRRPRKAPPPSGPSVLTQEKVRRMGAKVSLRRAPRPEENFLNLTFGIFSPEFPKGTGG